MAWVIIHVCIHIYIHIFILIVVCVSCCVFMGEWGVPPYDDNLDIDRESPIVREDLLALSDGSSDAM